MDIPVKLSDREEHPFVSRPNRTLMVLAVPIFFSLVAEPATGLVDTGFIARLGTVPLAAMGVGTAALSSIFWVLNFIAIGTQTNVAQSLGQQKEEKASRLTSLALLISAAAGILLIVIGWLLAPWAAHQAIRQVWFFTVLGLDALALAAQSLVGYFFGSERIKQARRVAAYVCAWGMVMGLFITGTMWLGRQTAADLLVPASAHAVFFLPWLASAFIQPINSLAFVTDGIHWGTSDFAYLRNAMLIATVAGSTLLFLVDISAADALLWIWLATAAWIFIRAIFGIVRIWPGLGNAPLGA